MFDSLLNLGGAARIDAAGCRFAGHADNRRITDRALCGHLKLRLASIPRRCNDFYDLGDDVPCSLHQDPIPDTNVFFLNFILVVQCRPADRNATDIHRFQMRHRCQCAGPPHLDFYGFDGRGFLDGFEFIGNRPSGAPGRGSQTLLQGDLVDFNYHPVDVVSQLMPIFTELPVEIQYRRYGNGGANQRVDPKAPFCQRLEKLAV